MEKPERAAPEVITLKSYLEEYILKAVKPAEYKYFVERASSVLTEFIKGKIYKTLEDQSGYFAAAFGAYGVGRIAVTGSLDIPDDMEKSFSQFIKAGRLDLSFQLKLQKILTELEREMSALEEK